MKSIFSLLTFIFFCLSANGQSVGINTTSPHPSAALDIKSFDQGILVPRLKESARLGIQNPATGLLVYDVDHLRFYTYNGSEWVGLSTNDAFENFYGLVRNGGNVYQDDFLFGAHELPPNGQMVTDTSFFFDKSKGAFRIGRTNNSDRSSESNIGKWSVAGGSNNLVSGANSTAFGSNNIVSANFSSALGTDNESTGEYSFTAGAGNKATDIGSTAVGFFNESNGYSSFSAGFGVKADSYTSIAIGQYNVGGGSSSGWNLLDPIFEVGIGTDFVTDRRNAMTILKNGFVGIGTTTPGVNLTVTGVSRVAFDDTETDYIELVHKGGNAEIKAGGSGDIDIKHGNNHIMTLTSDQKVGVGTTSPDTTFSVIGVSRAAFDASETDYIEMSHGGTNAEIKAEGTGDIAVKHGNNRIMTLTADQRVGIGTSSPDTSLSVIGASRAAFDASETDFIEMGHGGYNAFINAEGTGNLDLRHEGSNVMTLTPGGRVGIRTNSPGTDLSVIGKVRAAIQSNENEFTEIFHGGDNGYINTVGDGDLQFRHDNNIVMSVSDDGDLDVDGSVTLDENTASPTTGMVRWNPQNEDFEGYNGEKWLSLTKPTYTWGNAFPFEVEFNQDIQPSGSVNGDRVGYSVAMNENYAVVGAPYDDFITEADRGAIYIYEKSGNDWIEIQKIISSDGDPGDLFGYSVDISDNYMIVGAYNHNNSKGAVYIFEIVGSVWQEQQKLEVTTSIQEGFGYDVSITDNYALVGSPFDLVGSKANQGTATFFRRVGSSWNFAITVTSSDGNAGDNFGDAVSIDGIYGVIGAKDHIAKGAAYIHKWTGANFSFDIKIEASNNSMGQSFGSAIDISDDVMIISDPEYGSNAGAVYFFGLKSTLWEEKQMIQASNSNIGQKFGQSVAIKDNYAMVGAEPEENGIKASMILNRMGDNWSHQATLNTEDDEFSSNPFAVALSSEYALRGVSSISGSSQGKIFFYKR